MPSPWAGKPCARCGGRKGEAFRGMKNCGRCAPAARREASDREHGERIEALYGITQDDYSRLYDAQGARCAICQRARGKRRRLAVDHDHATGEVRGLLCTVCNGMLAHARDDTEFFERAVAYLSSPPWRDLNKEAA